jgi:alkylhydroperoxidase family enzyme
VERITTEEQLTALVGEPLKRVAEKVRTRLGDLDQHRLAASRAAGVPQSKLDTLAGWREDDSFSAQERAALALAEAVTVLDGPVDQDLWDHATELFSEAELSDLLYLIGLINLYNRLNIAVEFPAELWREKGIGGLRPLSG